MSNFDFSTYLSPFTWRYGSKEMRQIFSEEHKYQLWRKIWVALARVENKAGLVSKEELFDLEKHQHDINIERILEIEKETKHDVVAAIKEFAEKAKVGGAKIHLGATSMDINDNADVMRIVEALTLIRSQIISCLKAFQSLIERYADFPCMGYTHLQPAEPTTLGYRFAYYTQDLIADSSIIRLIEVNLLKAKGLKGAVGTAASYERLLDDKKIDAVKFEQLFMDELALKAAEITNQTYPRKWEFWFLTGLASIAQSLYKFAFDLRIMQSPMFGEWSEPFGKKQVGSSAMPFKRNPINSEKICSLSRYVAQLPRVAWDNASLTLLERTLDDSANRRIIISDAFLATDEILKTAQKIIEGLQINETRMKKNLSTYGPFAAIEIILLEAAKHGGNRQELHELLREISMQAWGEINNGHENPLADLIKKSKKITQYISTQIIDTLMDPSTHIGLAPKKCRQIIHELNRLDS